MFKWFWDEKLNCYCAEHNPTIRADKNGNVFGGGGGGDTYQAPAAPAQPSTADAINAWVSSMPQVYETQMKYAPMEAAQQVQLAQQYAQPMGEAMQKAQSAMYPQTTALQENLATQAMQGMTSEVPDWMRQEYLSNLRANLGTNIGSPISADYVSRGLLEQKKGWQDYYRNLGLAATGRQPLTQASTPQTSNYMSTYTPGSVMGYTANNYGTAGGIYGSQLNYAGQMSGQKGGNYGGMGAGLGMLAGGLLALPTGGMSVPMGAMIGGGLGGGMGSMFGY
jgi:hypothetical protein